MDEDDFWSSLEHRVCREMDGVEECRAAGMWCDGFIARFVHRDEDPVRISGTAWIGFGPRQEEWEFDLLLPAGSDSVQIPWADLLPPDNCTAWLTIDPDRKRLVVAPGDAIEDAA